MHKSSLTSTQPPQPGFALWPQVSQEEIDAVTTVLRSGKVNYWTGEEGRQFEREFAAAVGTKHAIALANGTVALELALYALGVGPGNEVVVPSRTFLATGSSVVMRGATPVFAEVDRESQNVTAETVLAALTPRTRAVIVVHLAGWPCDMDPIMELARERNLFVIEDCAQAHGATYKGRTVGSIGHIGAFSFCQDKIMTTCGEGGMITLNDDELWSAAWSYKDHGKSWDAVYKRQHPSVFKWLHESIGTNWRLTEVQSAAGRVALRQLSGWVETRRRNAAILTRALSTLELLRLTTPGADFGHSYYKYYAFVRPERFRADWTRDRIISTLQAQGIPCGTGTCPEIYLEGAFKSRGTGRQARHPIAQELGETSLMFLVHPTLSEVEMYTMASAIERTVREATTSAASEWLRAA